MTTFDTADWAFGPAVGGGLVALSGISFPAAGSRAFGPWPVAQIPALTLVMTTINAHDWGFTWTWQNSLDVFSPEVLSTGTYLGNTTATTWDVVTNRAAYLSLVVSMGTGTGGLAGFQVMSVADASASNCFAPDRTLLQLDAISVGGTTTANELLSAQVPGPAVLWASCPPNASVQLQEYAGAGAWNTMGAFSVASTGVATNFWQDIVVPNNGMRVNFVNSAGGAQTFYCNIASQR